MSITVHGPNGVTIDFPDGTDSDTINKVMTQAVSGKATEPAPAPLDKYQQAAKEDVDQTEKLGLTPGYSRMLAHGVTMGADNTVMAALTTPAEMIRRGTWDPTEAYAFSKAREDEALRRARESTGLLGTGAEALGGAVTGAGAAKAGLTTARFLGQNAGLIPRALSSAADAAGFGAITGAMEGNGLAERGANALQGAGIGGAVGAGVPIALKMAGMFAAPIFANIKARMNPAQYAEEQFARGVSDSKLPAADIERSVQQAGAEGQNVFSVADAMGNSGQRMLRAAASGPGQGRTDIVDALEQRQAGQGRRVANALREGFGSPRTASQTEAAMTAARDAAADAEFSAVRSGAGNSQVDVVPALNNLDRSIGTTPGQIVPAANDSVEAALQPFRARLARVNPDDFEAVARIRGDMADAAEAAKRGGYGNRARLIGQAVRELDAAMEKASSGYKAANANFAQRTRDIEAVDAGRTAARSGRIEDTIPEFRANTPAGQNAYRAGYVDPLIAEAQGAAYGVNKARPLINDAFQAEGSVMAPGNDLMQRRIGRENTMFETRNTALGGSKTDMNLADASALGVSPEVMSITGHILSGNWGGAVKSALTAGSNLKNGNTAEVRAEVAKLLLKRAPDLAPGELQRIVDGVTQRIKFVQDIARSVGRGAAGGFAVSTAGAGGQRRNR